MTKRSLFAFAALALVPAAPAAETVALWLFDEPLGLYPSTPLESAAGIDAPLVLGPAGSVVEGKFGRALSTVPFPAVEIPTEGEETAALHRFPTPAGRMQAPRECGESLVPRQRIGGAEAREQRRIQRFGVVLRRRAELDVPPPHGYLGP